jgi:hypothetical protein
MPDDIELNIDKTVDDFIQDVAPGSEPPPDDVTLAPKAPPATTSLAKPATPGAPEPIAYPKSWKQDLAPHWDKMPRELQDYVTNTREKDYLNGLEQYKTGHTAYAEFAEVLQPYMPRINSLGMRPAEAIRALMNADWALSQGTPEQKAAMVAQICQNYGIDPRTLPLGGGDPNAPQPTAAELELRKKYDGLESNLKGFMQSQIAEKRGVIDKEVAAFAADPTHPHFDAVSDHIVRLLNADRNLSLQDAYDQAVWANPTTRAKAVEILNKETADKARKEREAAAQAAQKARLANVRGKPTDKTTGAAKGGWEEQLPVTAAAIESRTK